MKNIVSFLFLTYNRSDLLAKAVESLREAIARAHLEAELVVSDDASNQEHQSAIDALGFDVQTIAKVNSGLGANQNRGIACCSGDNIFQIQDDLIFVGQPADLTDALEVLGSDPEIGIVQLTEVSSDLELERRMTPRGVLYEVFRNDHLPWHRNCGVRPYSDLPHVKSARFVKDIGPYVEGLPMTLTEQDFKRRVACQSRWRVAQITGRRMFIHLGADHSHNPGGKRSKLVSLLHMAPYVGTRIEPTLRNMWKKADHVAAVLASRILS